MSSRAEIDSIGMPERIDLASLEWLRPSLMGFFERRVGLRADAEDLTQEVFLHLARAADPHVMREPGRYVFRVATNVLRDRFRRRAARRHGDHVSLTDSDIESELPSAERVCEGQQILEHVLGVLAQLTPRCRATFILHRFEGLSYTEIARRLGVSRSAVEKQMMHVLQVLSDRFPD